MPPTHGRFVVDYFEPAYRASGIKNVLPDRARAALESLRSCRACPRHCNVNRLAGEMGLCHTGRYARVSSAFPHHGEEDCLRGHAGSGTIFFARCNLGCVFCQNSDISHRDAGRECTPDQIAELMLALQFHGCHNVNLVTPTHVVPQILEAIALAVEAGLHLPIVYNTGAYDSLESLRQLDSLVDVYMPDFKFFSEEPGARYLNAADYGQRARDAIAEMHRQVGNLHVTPDGIACRGLLVRHLVMPGLLDETADIFHWLAEHISKDTFVNVMAQYRPANRVGQPLPDGGVRYEEINRPLTRYEFARALDLARQAGLWRFD